MHRSNSAAVLAALLLVAAAVALLATTARAAELPAPHGAKGPLMSAPAPGGGLAANAVAKKVATKKAAAKKTTKKSAKQTAAPKKKVPVNLGQACKSGMYYFTSETVAFSEAEFTEKTEWLVTYDPYKQSVRLTPEGLRQIMVRSRERINGYFNGMGSVLTSTRRMRRGRITARMRIGPRQGPGVVSAFITMAPNGDEIDFEWTMGKTPTGATNNWFRKGQPWYGRDTLCQIPGDARWAFHEYTIEWAEDHVAWYVDGRHCRTVRKWDWPLAGGDHLFPEEPPNIQFGIWDGGFYDGTRDWVGGRIPWESPESDAGYDHTISWVRVDCL
ncbi:concanavalin A-like lectin/glucanase domain-containing protein [Hyaloraphidium curvatum]|nr:concanavalin A-like lectin/glucanase domain-containing protein [Hyaloraphidium curvatum]